MFFLPYEFLRKKRKIENNDVVNLSDTVEQCNVLLVKSDKQLQYEKLRDRYYQIPGRYNEELEPPSFEQLEQDVLSRGGAWMQGGDPESINFMLKYLRHHSYNVEIYNKWMHIKNYEPGDLTFSELIAHIAEQGWNDAFGLYESYYLYPQENNKYEVELLPTDIPIDTNTYAEYAIYVGNYGEHPSSKYKLGMPFPTADQIKRNAALRDYAINDIGIQNLHTLFRHNPANVQSYLSWVELGFEPSEDTTFSQFLEFLIDDNEWNKSFRK